MTYRKIKNLAPLVILSLSYASASFCAFAEEVTKEKIENKADDVGTDAKKSGRKLKRKMRDATGNGSVVKDLEDKKNDVKDDIYNKSRKLKRNLKSAEKKHSKDEKKR